MPFTSPAEARAAVKKSWKFTEDRRARTQPSREAFFANLHKKIDPDNKLPPHERSRRATEAYREHFKSLAAKSIKARKRRKSSAKPRRQRCTRAP
jgi:hypothetical protein